MKKLKPKKERRKGQLLGQFRDKILDYCGASVFYNKHESGKPTLAIITAFCNVKVGKKLMPRFVHKKSWSVVEALAIYRQLGKAIELAMKVDIENGFDHKEALAVMPADLSQYMPTRQGVYAAIPKEPEKPQKVRGIEILPVE